MRCVATHIKDIRSGVASKATDAMVRLFPLFIHIIT